jgi:hypothetical protein
VDEVNDVRLIEIHTSEPLVLDSGSFEVEIGIGKLKSYKSPGIDQIEEGMFQTRDRTLCSKIYKFIRSVWNKE